MPTKPGNLRRATYVSWKNMLYRCTDPRNAQYADYGERGIGVCSRWTCFENFLEDMGLKPEGLTLERINNAEGYTPKNCRWATRADQMRNQRKTIRVNVSGVEMCLKDATKNVGVHYLAVWRRMRKGLSFSEAVAAAKLWQSRQ